MKQIELYNREELNRAKQRQNRSALWMAAIGAAGLCVCIALCVGTTRKNADTMLPFIIGASVAAGWMVIFLSHAVFGKARATVRHTDLMLTGERETFVGRFEKTDEVRRVKHGVPVRKVRAYIDGYERVLSVSESKAERLPDAFAGRVETVYDFVAAYEVEDDQRDPA